MISAKPETLEACWEVIAMMDVEVVGAMDDLAVAKRRIREVEEERDQFAGELELIRRLTPSAAVMLVEQLLRDADIAEVRRHAHGVTVVDNNDVEADGPTLQHAIDNMVHAREGDDSEREKGAGT